MVKCEDTLKFVVPTKELVGQAIQYSRNLKLVKVILACYKDNIPSSKTILKCGGKLTKEFTYSDGKEVSVYWITL